MNHDHDHDHDLIPLTPEEEATCQRLGWTTKAVLDDFDPDHPIVMHPLYNQHGDYITDSRGGVDYIRWLLRHGIHEPLLPSPVGEEGPRTCAIGRCTIGEHAGMWLGWSHRASRAFGIGSRVEKTDLAYVAPSAELSQMQAIHFWSGDTRLNVRIDCEGVDEEGVPGCWVAWETADTVPNTKMHGQTQRYFWHYPRPWGRGAWTAETDDDARQMACDFARNMD